MLKIKGNVLQYSFEGGKYCIEMTKEYHKENIGKDIKLDSRNWLFITEFGVIPMGRDIGNAQRRTEIDNYLNKHYKDLVKFYNLK